MPINFDLLRKAQDEYTRIEVAAFLERDQERRETEAHAINEFIDWLKPLGIKPDEVSYGAGNAFIYSDGLTFTREQNYSEDGFSYRLCITRQATGHSGYLGVFLIDPANWDVDWLLKKQSQIMNIIDGLMKEPVPEPADDALVFDPDEQPVPYFPCWLGAISEIGIDTTPDTNEPGYTADLPDEFEAHFDAPPDDDDNDYEEWFDDDGGDDSDHDDDEPVRSDGMTDSEYEKWLDNQPPAELVPPQESFIPPTPHFPAALPPLYQGRSKGGKSAFSPFTRLADGETED